jgi:hypothetical protein
VFIFLSLGLKGNLVIVQLFVVVVVVVVVIVLDKEQFGLLKINKTKFVDVSCSIVFRQHVQ